jgi:hypothetical protein
MPAYAMKIAMTKQMIFLYMMNISHVNYASLYPVYRKPNLILLASVPNVSFSFCNKKYMSAGIPILHTKIHGSAKYMANY